MATRTQKKTETSVSPKQPDALVVRDENGSVRIDPGVVSKIAGLAIREVDGVYALASYGAGQAITNLAQSLRGDELKDLGVRVEVGLLEAAVDCRIVTEYGASIPDVADALRKNLSGRIQEMTGLKVKEINIEVVDLHFDEDDVPAASPRVR